MCLILDWQMVEAIAIVFGVIVALIGVIVGMKTYWRQVRNQQLQWLMEFSREFFQRFHKTRRMLDYKTQEEVKMFIEEGDEKESEGFEEFTDFLNHFEMLAYMRKQKGLKDEDILAMYNYYLKLILKHPQIKEYCDKKDYENLSGLLQWYANKNK